MKINQILDRALLNVSIGHMVSIRHLHIYGICTQILYAGPCVVCTQKNHINETYFEQPRKLLRLTRVAVLCL